MCISIAHLTVPAASQLDLERRFPERAGLVDDCPGIRHPQLLRPRQTSLTEAVSARQGAAVLAIAGFALQLNDRLRAAL